MPDPPVLRRARPDDAPAIAAVFAAAARAAWLHIVGAEALAALDEDPEPWRRRLAEESPPAATWVAELDGAVVGFAILGAGARPGEGELELLYTDPSAWGAGAGRALLARAEAELRAAGFAEATLWTEHRNDRPLRVYAAAGWEPDGTARERTWHGAALRELRLRKPLAVAPRPALLAQLSDPHVRVGPGDGASAGALAAAVDAVLSLGPPPDAVLVSGDLADHAASAEYERVGELLAPLPVPVHAFPGNHDDPEALQALLGSPPRFAVGVGALRLVGCDSTLAGRDEGGLGEERLAWLRARLAEEPAAPTVVAMHHPPLLTGIPVLDAIGLPASDRAALAAVLADAPQVRLVVAGHVHRAVVGALADRPVVTAPSTHRQARLEIGGTEFAFRAETPAFLLHVLVGGRVLTHVQPITR